MHSVGELIVYGNSGVMELIDVREESVGGVGRSYYVLKPRDSADCSLTFVPVDNAKLVDTMRPLLTKEEAIEVVRAARSEGALAWIEDNRLRSDSFKKTIQSGSRKDILRMIESIRNAEGKRQREGKKGFISDENLIKKAEKLIYSEFSVIFGVPEADVRKLISEL